MRACQCTFCRKHAALGTSDPGGDLRFSADASSELQRYRFALRTADFLICRRCGVYVGAIIETARGAFGIVNLRALHAAPDDVAPTNPVSYADESIEQRRKRRRRGWTPVSACPWD